MRKKTAGMTSRGNHRSAGQVVRVQRTFQKIVRSSEQQNCTGRKWWGITPVANVEG